MRTSIKGLVTGVAAAGVLAFVFGPAQASDADRRQAEIELGRRLFQDPAVSGAGKFSCASCHDAEHGFSDPRQFSVDENGATARHSQPLTDMAGVGFHWDGEFDSVRQLLTARLAPPREALAQARLLHQRHFQIEEAAGRKPDKETFDARMRALTPPYYGPLAPTGPITPSSTIANRLDHGGLYAAGMLAAYGDTAPTSERVIDAMAAYIDTLKTTESPYDRYLAGDESALGESAQRGLALFRGRAGCAECHDAGKPGERATFTDGKFHNTGVSYRLGQAGRKQDPSNVGRSAMSFVADDVARFKTPSLRDVALRPPYMHDGAFETLADVVSYYDRGGTKNAHLDKRVKRLLLSDSQEADLVAFLESLTGAERPGLGRATRDRARQLSVEIEDLDGNPVRGLAFSAEPFGDRLVGVADPQTSFHSRTGRSGSGKIALPGTTHLTLAAEGYELEATHPIPDWVETVTVIATPRDKISVRIRSEKTLPDTIGANPVASDGNKTSSGFTLTRVRQLSPTEALYVADARTHGEVEVFQLTCDLTANTQTTRAVLLMAEIDTGGGMSQPIDLSLGRLSVRGRRPPGTRPGGSGGSGGTAPGSDAPTRPGGTDRPGDSGTGSTGGRRDI